MDAYEKLRCKEKAVGLLARKRYTVYGLQQKLQSLEWDAAVIDDISDELIEQGYLNDLDYAARYIKDAVNLNGYGYYRVARGLEEKGVDEAVYERAFAAAHIDWDALLREQLAKKLRGVDPSDRRALEKVKAYFVRRGFSYDQIGNALAAILEII